MDREKQLKETYEKLYLQKKLMGKGTVIKTKPKNGKPSQYRFKKERKR